MIIAIGGVSRAGKSTLATLLRDSLKEHVDKVEIVGQDLYVFEEDKIPKIKNKVNWESPESIDFKKFKKAIISVKKKNDIVIVEGLLVYYNEDLNSLYDQKLFIDIPKALFLKRKVEDLRWGKKPEPKWYIEHIWKSYREFGLENLPSGVVHIPGNKKFEINKIVKSIMGLTPEEELFNRIADNYTDRYKSVERGPMMSAPGIRYKNKNFAFFHKNEMTFKLGKKFNAEANGINEIRHLSPFKTKPPLTAWYIISADQKELWEDLAEIAFEYIQHEVK